MEKYINNKLIRSFNPCYDPSEKVSDENESLPVIEWVTKYRATVPAQDIIWLLCRKEFMADRDCRLFAVWCAREALKLIETPDHRSIDACNVAERYANGEATKEELDAARDAAWDAAWAARDAAWAAARDAAWAARDAARDAAWAAARDAARDAQLNKLMTYFEP